MRRGDCMNIATRRHHQRMHGMAARIGVAMAAKNEKQCMAASNFRRIGRCTVDHLSGGGKITISRRNGINNRVAPEILASYNGRR